MCIKVLFLCHNKVRLCFMLIVQGPPNTQSVLKTSKLCQSSVKDDFLVGDPLSEVNRAQLQPAVLTVSSVVSKLGQGSERWIRPERRLSHISSKRPRLSFFPAVYTHTHTHCAGIRSLGQFGFLFIHVGVFKSSRVGV